MEAGLWLNQKVREAMALLVANFVPTDVIVILFGLCLDVRSINLSDMSSLTIVIAMRWIPTR